MRRLLFQLVSSLAVIYMDSGCRGYKIVMLPLKNSLNYLIKKNL